MDGERILVRSLSFAEVEDSYHNIWQYHPQSDRHSKIACWAIMFDLLEECALLRHHVAEGRVAYGINHSMIDFTSNRKKDLDLVVCMPRADAEPSDGKTFAELADHYGIHLTPDELERLSALPVLVQKPVGDVLVALEAKAAMTKHTGAGPRFYDELTSAWQCINGSSPHALAIGYGIVNASERFVSPKQNKFKIGSRPRVTNTEKQPRAAKAIQRRFEDLKVRGSESGHGFDALGLTTLLMRNDGSPVTLAPSPPSYPHGDPHHYDTMIQRVAGLYDGRFKAR